MTTRVATLAAACAICTVATARAIATASPAGDRQASTTTVHTPASQRVTISLGGAAPVAATSTTRGFLGIATELNTIPALSGSAADPDPPFDQLLRNLSPGAPLVLRLGGNSADDSWWPVPGKEMPPYIYALTPRWGSEVQALLTALGGKAILGVNLEEGAKIAGAEVADFDRYVGTGLIDDFELGNEPEFYRRRW